MIKVITPNTILFIAVFIVTACFASCKKGKEDPLISFRSRMARITNNWEVYTLNTEWVNGNTSGNWTVANNKMVVNSNNSPTDYYDYFFSLSINGDNTYSIDQAYVHQDTMFNSSYYTEGRWNFLDKSDGYKNKERILLSPLKSISKKSNGTTEALLLYQNSGEIMEIDGLCYKQLTITSNYKKNDNVFTKTQMCLKCKK